MGINSQETLLPSNNTVRNKQVSFVYASANEKIFIA